MDRKELSENIQDINARLDHLEDATMDNRSLLVKLVKQSNKIVEFLRAFEGEDIIDESYNTNRGKSMKELINEYLDQHSDLIEFEKELDKYKDQLTPNIKAES